ncbi:MAG: hypothetical protein V7752_07130 [Halopseudomonas sp.]
MIASPVFRALIVVFLVHTLMGCGVGVYSKFRGDAPDPKDGRVYYPPIEQLSYLINGNTNSFVSKKMLLEKYGEPSKKIYDEETNRENWVFNLQRPERDTDQTLVLWLLLPIPLPYPDASPSLEVSFNKADQVTDVVFRDFYEKKGGAGILCVPDWGMTEGGLCSAI